MLASPVFRVMLQSGRFSEGRTLNSTGNVEIQLLDDDPDTFKFILDIIHGGNKQVPRKLDLAALAKISTVVHKYQMTEAVESFSEAWISALTGDLEVQYCKRKEKDNVHRWLATSWAFGREKEFKEMTFLMERGCYANLTDVIEESLPIPQLVVGKFHSHDIPVPKLNFLDTF